MFKNKDGKVRSGWKIAAALGVFFVILFFAEMIFSIVLVLSIAGSGGSIFSLLGNLNEQLMDWAWLLNILQTVIMIAVAVFTWKVIFKRRLEAMGLPRFGAHAKELGWGLLIGAVSMTLIFLLLLAFGILRVQSWTPVISADTFLYLFIFVLVGFAEEIFFRGYCISVLRQTRSLTMIFIISAVLFSLMHLTNPGYSFSAFINIAIVGLLFAYMYIKSGNIWMPIGFHITWNYFQGCVFGLKTSGLGVHGLIQSEYLQHNFLGGSAFGPEEGLFATIVLLAGFLFVKWYYRKSSLDFLAMDSEKIDKPQK